MTTSTETGNDPESTPGAVLLLSNVPHDCNEDYLRMWVEARGFRVSRLNLIEDRVSHTSPSFAHVQLMHIGRAEEAARALNGLILRGHTIRVQLLVPRKWQSEKVRKLRLSV